MPTMCRRTMRRRADLLILDVMRTPPRWLREQRRAARAAASPESLAAEVAWRVEAERSGLAWKPPLPPDWKMPGEPLSEEEWEAFVAALEEARGYPMPLLHSSTPTSSPC
jgi:hypothetical protein